MDGWMDVTRRTKNLAAQEVVNWGVESDFRGLPFSQKIPHIIPPFRAMQIV